MRMKRSITNITKQIAILVIGLPAILTPLALLALPTSPDDWSDANMFSSIEIVLSAGRAEQKVLELLWR